MPETITRELARWVAQCDLPVGSGLWRRLGSADTNFVWRVPGVEDESLVVKLFRPTRSTPLFPNDADAEWTALCDLQGSGIAPLPIDRATAPCGEIIISTYVRGKGNPDPHILGAGLRDLHGRATKRKTRGLVLEGGALLATCRAMIAECDPTHAAMLSALAPDMPSSEPIRKRSFLHGDPVASNVLDHAGRVVFIDWQCPASGDPVFDLACALSPSMRLSCGPAPFTEREVDDVLNGYGDAETADRYRRWRAIFAWRFACYAAWCGANGRAGREAGLQAELDLLNRLGQ